MTRLCACRKVSHCHIIGIPIFFGDDRPLVDRLRVLLDRELSAVHLSQELLPPNRRSAGFQTDERHNPLSDSVGKKEKNYSI
jgi:hypothetical protein